LDALAEFEASTTRSRTVIEKTKEEKRGRSSITELSCVPFSAPFGPGVDAGFRRSGTACQQARSRAFRAEVASALESATNERIG
jgi:hypothetical protein